MKKHNVIEVVTGFVILCVAFFSVVYLYVSKNKSFNDTYPLFAFFDSANGLKEGSDVKLSGVRVGYISDMSLDKESYRAKVTLSIDKAITLPKDSIAEVLSESLLGGKYIGLSPGSDAELLKNDEEITLTQSSINFESFLSKFLFSGQDDKKEEKEEKEERKDRGKKK